ncbi:DUF6580 family putative transport protein [Edaphobacter sp. 12200R-103]|jgi:hypothetical protein|uniref:DUF6580 family putative transport protein n=1 Tax=Edaphobacter sp. 12200R-103 TaxID=2703788 RepID=UPI00138CA233|nr:DUF6580 family putative transport protein [Edaphobacter sp. 12200R-103]QHS53266.1 DUF4175 domain-containing protein [Edaphobacter sp. 12200R-103]
MAAYFALIVAVLSRILPFTLHSTGVGFTAVGGGLLYFGARRGRWHTIAAVLALMATDFYLTAFVYKYAFHASDYLVTWLWYAGVCLLGHQMLSHKQSALRVAGAVLATSTSFFLLSNFEVWAAGTMYAHSMAGLAECYVAAIPFYANDMMSTAMTVGAFFGLPALARNVAATMREGLHNQRPA